MQGDFKSIFKGSGLEFDDIRTYQYGDDIRSIDWNVTAKGQGTFLKTFKEEKEQTVFFLLDVSASQQIGKEGKTSWDSFSYAILMCHNVWMHINAVQEANRQYDKGSIPNMLVNETFDRVMVKDIVEAIFSTSDRTIADAIIKEYSKYWMSIIGTRGATGKKTVNASTQFNNLFEEV